MLIETGTQVRLIAEETAAGGETIREGSVKSDAILVTLFAGSVSSGSLNVTVYTLTDEGKEVAVITFPAVSAPTTELLLQKSGVILQRFRIVATYDDVCSYEIYVRAISGSGESSVRIIGAAELETSAVVITSAPSVLIASSLTDRNGLTIKNYTGSGTLFVSESLAKLPAQAWPISPGEVWFLDVAAGVEIYGVSSGSNLDVRIAESGG